MAKTTFLIFFLVFKFCAADENVVKSFSEIIEYSFDASICVYLLCIDTISASLVQALLKKQIQIALLAPDNFNQTVKYPQCNGYIISTSNSTVLSTIMEENSFFPFKPHERIIIFFDGFGLDKSAFTFASDIKAMDVIIIEGRLDTPIENDFLNNFLTSEVIQVTSLSKKKVIAAWNYSEEINMDKKLFERVKWTPRFVYNSKTYKFKVVVFSCKPYILYDSEKGLYGGIDLKILNEIAKDWPIHFVYLSDEQIRPKYDFWLSALRAVATGSSDLCLCSQWQTSSAHYNVDISHPYGQSCGTFLVLKPRELPRTYYVFQPLTITLWSLAIVTFLVSSLALSVVAKCYDIMGFDRHPYVHFSISILDVVRCCTLASMEYFNRTPQPKHLKLILLFLSIYSLFFVTVYSSGLASVLSYPIYEKSVSTFSDMLNQKIYWEDSNDYGSMRDTLESAGKQVLREVADFQITDVNISEMNKRIFQEKHAIAVKRIDNGYVTDTDLLDDYSKTHLRILKECYLHTYTVFPLKKNSPFTSVFNTYLSRVFEHGLIKKWYTETIRELREQYISNFYNDYSNEVRQNISISLSDIQGGFYFLCVGNVLALLTFIYEHFCKYTVNRRT